MLCFESVLVIPQMVLFRNLICAGQDRSNLQISASHDTIMAVICVCCDELIGLNSPQMFSQACLFLMKLDLGGLKWE